MTEFQIKRGYKEYLIDENGNALITLEEGCWYLTLDTAEIYVAINNQLRLLNEADINLDDYDERFDSIEARLDALENRAAGEGKQEVYTFAEYDQFPTHGEANVIYIALDKNASYVYVNNVYMCIGNTETSDIDIQLIDGGSAE